MQANSRNILERYRHSGESSREIHAYLKKRGMRLEDADIFIAAIAIVRGLILVSHDSDMLRIPELTVEDWLLTAR